MREEKDGGKCLSSRMFIGARLKNNKIHKQTFYLSHIFLINHNFFLHNIASKCKYKNIIHNQLNISEPVLIENKSLLLPTCVLLS